jgi:hypothetical protein
VKQKPVSSPTMTNQPQVAAVEVGAAEAEVAQEVDRVVVGPVVRVGVAVRVGLVVVRLQRAAQAVRVEESLQLQRVELAVAIQPVKSWVQLMKTRAAIQPARPTTLRIQPTQRNSHVRAFQPVSHWSRSFRSASTPSARNNNTDRKSLEPIEGFL